MVVYIIHPFLPFPQFLSTWCLRYYQTEAWTHFPVSNSNSGLHLVECQEEEAVCHIFCRAFFHFLFSKAFPRQRVPFFMDVSRASQPLT